MGSKHAVLISYLALFIALGGTATALQGRYSVKADDLATGSVGKRALKARSVGVGELKGQAVGRRNIRPRSIGAGHIRRQAVGAWALRSNSVGTFNLKAGAVESRALQDGTVTSESLGPQTEISFGSGGKIRRRDIALRIGTSLLEWGYPESDAPAVIFDSSPTGGGGVILDGSRGPQSGYLQLKEGNGQPPGLGGVATLVARDMNEDGKTELVVFWEGGVHQVLATEP